MIIWDGVINILVFMDNGIWVMDLFLKFMVEMVVCFDCWWDFVQFVQDVFIVVVGMYLDKNNVVDFYVFFSFICVLDCVQKNIMFIIWDGMKWFFMFYDLDIIFGLYYVGMFIVYLLDLNLFDNGFVMQVNCIFWKKVCIIFQVEMNVCYVELWDNGLFLQCGVLELV